MGETDGIINREERKHLFSNFSWLFLLQVASYLFPLMTIPYLARVIGADGLGKIAVAAVVSSWVYTISDWGFKYTATRDMARIISDKQAMAFLYSNVIYAKMLLFSICLLVILIASFFVPFLRDESMLLFFSLLIVLGKILLAEWFYQSMGKMKYITMFNVFVRILFSLLVFLFITKKEDYYIQPLFLSSGFLISGIFSFLLMYKKWEITFQKSSLFSVIQLLRSGFPVFLSGFMPNLYNSFSQCLLFYEGGSSASGSYDVGNKFFTFANQLLSVVSVVFFPFLSQKISAHKLYALIAISLSLLFSLFLFFLGPILFPYFFSDEFASSVVIMKILSLSLPFMAITSVYGTNYMVLNGMEKQYSWIISLTSLLGFVFSFPLIMYFHELGVAVLLLGTRFLTALLVYLYVARRR